MDGDIIECDLISFEKYCRELADKLDLAAGDAVVVLKAGRAGGLFLGRLIEEIKGMEVYELNYEIKKTDNEVIIEPVGPVPLGLANRRVFLLTEIANRGLVLRRALNDLGEHGNRVIVGAVYYREGSIVVPDIYVNKVSCYVKFTDWE